MTILHCGVKFSYKQKKSPGPVSTGPCIYTTKKPALLRASWLNFKAFINKIPDTRYIAQQLLPFTTTRNGLD